MLFVVIVYVAYWLGHRLYVVVFRDYLLTLSSLVCSAYHFQASLSERVICLVLVAQSVKSVKCHLVIDYLPNDCRIIILVRLSVTFLLDSYSTSFDVVQIWYYFIACYIQNVISFICFTKIELVLRLSYWTTTPRIFWLIS